MHWIKEIALLSAVALTAQAQVFGVNDIDPAKQMLYPALYSEASIDSIVINEILNLDERYVSDRRPWNARGRRIPMQVPKTTETTIVPIEAYDTLDELELTKLREKANHNLALFRDIVGNSIPARIKRLVAANHRRVEVDAIEAWAKGQITVRNSETGLTEVVSLGFGSSRYQVASTAWDDGGEDAFVELVAFVKNAKNTFGQVRGVMLSQQVLDEITKDAPNNIPGINQAVEVTKGQLEEMLTKQFGHGFKFFVNERTADVFDNAGTAFTRTRVWPVGVVAAIPAGSATIGTLYKAPSTRAMHIMAEAGGKSLEQQGMMVFPESTGNGRGLTIECQCNWIPLPNENWVYVVDTLIT